jgi:phosphatidylserine/phosphatidylglycerophosphate/cardiolipin synthase-like enzyme
MFAAAAQAQELTARTSPEAMAAVRAVFTPGDDVAGQIVAAVRAARQQVLVQAYSFTHEGIAKALIAAQARGVDVKLIADRAQTENIDHSQTPVIASAGVPVWLDGEHQSAHNKLMIIDAGTSMPVIVTGSFNFTRAAQSKNAENVVFISGNEVLARAYVKNWEAHLSHAKPLTIH